MQQKLDELSCVPDLGSLDPLSAKIRFLLDNGFSMGAMASSDSPVARSPWYDGLDIAEPCLGCHIAQAPRDLHRGNVVFEVGSPSGPTLCGPILA